MTIDKILSKNFKENPIINYDIFLNNIYPYITNLYLNNTEKNKRIIEIFKNDMKKYTIEAFGKNYQQQDFWDIDASKEEDYYGIEFVDFDYDEDEDVNNSIIIGLQAKTKKFNIDALEAIKYNEDEIEKYHLEIQIWLKNINLTNNSIKIIKNYLKNKLNKKNKDNNTQLTYFNLDKMTEGYVGAGHIRCVLYIQHKFDKKNDDWKQFQKILIDANFNKENIDNSKEIEILKKIFLDKILNLF